jgi:hypothetical protein
MKGTAIVAMSDASGVEGLEPKKTTARKAWASFNTTVYSLYVPLLSMTVCTIVSHTNRMSSVLQLYIASIFLCGQVLFLVFAQNFQ